MESGAAAHGVDTIDEFFFVGPDEVFVEARADEGGGGVADPDEVSAGVELGFGEAEFHIDDELEQVLDERGVIEEI
ncbi:MAG: hypothetical protein RI897_139 [Verrucomicrobiota bacterium]